MENYFPEGWFLLPLEDCIEAIIDYRGKTPRKSPFGIPLITAKIVKNGRIEEPNEFIPFEDYDERMQRGIPKAGDVVVTTEAPLGEVAQLDGRKLSVGQRLITLRGKDGLLDNSYLKFLMMSEFVQNQLVARATGTTVIGIKQKELRKILLAIPPYTEQRTIAGILDALDNKIELNRRMNQTLESMARAVFAEMMKDESGRMKVGTVGEDFNLTMGQSPPGETYNEEGEGIPFFQGRADFGFRYPENRVYCTAPTRFAKAGDTLVSVRAPVGDVNMAKEECAIGRGVAAVRHKTGSRSYTYYAMKSLEEDFGKFEAEGTVFGSINKADFQNLEIGIPTTEQVEQFEKTCYPIEQMIENNEKESRTLASLRDTLLPRLMRGEVRVRG